MLRTTLLLLAAFFYTSPALAAWGENWGVMVWGAAPSAVPSIDGLGLGLLLLVLIGLAIRGLRSRATLGLMVLASFVGAADLAEAQVTIPNLFTNGEVADAGEVNANFSALANALDVTVPNSFANSGIADANQVNSNFDVLKTAVDTFTNDLAAATSATETAFTNGSVQGAASVDITTDNAAADGRSGAVRPVPKPVAHGTRGRVPAPRPRLRTTVSLGDSARRQRLTSPRLHMGIPTSMMDIPRQQSQP